MFMAVQTKMLITLILMQIRMMALVLFMAVQTQMHITTMLMQIKMMDHVNPMFMAA